MGEASRKIEWMDDAPVLAQPGPNTGVNTGAIGAQQKWLSPAELSDLAGIDRRNAERALDAKRWRGVDLMVRVETGTRGFGGQTKFVHVDSLPADLRTAWYLGHGIQLHARVDAATGELRHVAEAAQDPRFDERQAVARWRLDVIRQVVAKPKGSPERRALLEAVAAQEWRAPDGKLRQIGRATLYAWVAAYDAGGLIGLLPDERKDRGIKRVLVSTAWDGYFAGRIAPADHAAVAEAVTKHIRSLWASGESGWRAICEKSTTRLIELTLDLRDPIFRTLAEGRPGDRAGAPTRFGICDVNRRMAEAQRSYGIIAVRNKDNARFQDTIAPTIRRDYSLLSPREIVVGDVHPTDVMVLRPDGSRAYPKAISWFDPATCEVHMTIVLLEKGEGVRRERVAMAFEAMVHEWGLPKLLYLDNGSDYGWAEMITGFTQLSKLAGLTVKEHGGGSLADARVAEAREAVVRSLAYNAKGKPGIEGTFGVLEQVFFSNFLGWTAGERIRKKTHAKGRDPIPFNGDMAAFMGQVGTALEWYHKRPQHGRLAGRSPNEVLRSHIDAGWGKVVLARPEVLALAFSTEETRVVSRGTVAFTPRHGRSQRYYCEALLGLLPGTQITIRIPAYDPQYLFCFAADGELIGMAHPERQYSPLDPAGAHEVAARGKFLRRHITERSRHVALLDLVEETARHIGHLPAAPDMPVAAVVDAGMLDRMARVDAEARARLAAPDAGPRRSAPSQWKSAAPNAALQAVQFEDDEEEV